MAREGIEKLLNIKDRSYNILNKIDFKYHVLYNYCGVNLYIFLIRWKEK